MGILDRLKPQPRWKHADAAIRLEALRDLDDPVELAVLAETDPDVRVRKACIARTSDVAVLSRIAAQDVDAETQDRAADRLQAIAIAPETEEALAVTAVRGIADLRRLSTIAKSEASDGVRADALSRTSDERALGSIARHARREATAAQALARIADTKELLDTALNGDHKDVALGAFDRVVSGPECDQTLLRSIESRTQQKAVAKRARTMIQEIEAAEAARVAAEEERRRQRAALLESIERVPELTDIPRAESEVARLTASWGEIAGDDDAAAARFEQRRQAALEIIAERRRQAEEAAERARQRDEALATADALCARAETLEGDDILEQLAPIEEEWRSLVPLVGSGPEADRLAERLAASIAGCRKRHELGAVLIETRARLEALVLDADGLLAQDDAMAAAARWQEIVRDARGLAATLEEGMRPVADLSARLAAVQEGFAAREAAQRQAAEKAHQDLVERLRRLVERAKRATEADSVTLREGERLMRDLSAALDEAGRGETSKDLQEATARLRKLQEKIAPQVRELREMDEWRRFANAQQQEQLIAMAEAIVASLKSDMETGKDSDLIATARALRELNAKWQEVAEAPRHSAQRLWDQFRTATEFIRSRCEGYFAKLRAGTRYQPAEESFAGRGGRGAGCVDRLGQGHVAFPGTADRMAADRPRSPRCRPRPGASVPHRVQPVLPATPRGPRRAQEGLGREPRAQGSALCARGSARRINRLGRGVGRNEATAVGMEADRPGAPQQV